MDVSKANSCTPKNLDLTDNQTKTELDIEKKGKGMNGVAGKLSSSVFPTVIIYEVLSLRKHLMLDFMRK